MMINLAKDALIPGGYCVVLILDVKNAFNYATGIELRGVDVSVPGYLADYWVLCYVTYNGGGVLPALAEGTIVGFADDLIVVVIGKHSEVVEIYATQTVRAAKSRIEKAKLTRADKKKKQ